MVHQVAQNRTTMTLPRRSSERTGLPSGAGSSNTGIDVNCPGTASPLGSFGESAAGIGKGLRVRRSPRSRKHPRSGRILHCCIILSPFRSDERWQYTVPQRACHSFSPGSCSFRWIGAAPPLGKGGGEGVFFGTIVVLRGL